MNVFAGFLLLASASTVEQTPRDRANAILGQGYQQLGRITAQVMAKAEEFKELLVKKVNKFMKKGKEQGIILEEENLQDIDIETFNNALGELMKKVDNNEEELTPGELNKHIAEEQKKNEEDDDVEDVKENL